MRPSSARVTFNSDAYQHFVSGPCAESHDISAVMGAKTKQRFRETNFPVVDLITELHFLRSCVFGGILNMIRGQ